MAIIKVHQNRMAVCMILLLLAGYHSVTVAMTVLDDIDDGASTYDNSEEDAFALTSRSRDHIKSSRQQLPQFTNSDRDLIRQSEQLTEHDNSHNSERPRSQNSQVIFSPTPLPHSKSSPRATRRHDNRRTTKRLINLHKSSRSQSRDDLDLPDDKAELTNVVLELRDQLKESQSLQTITRSILNVIQEKQQALEDDLSFLKNEISTLHRQQSKDHNTISALKELVADNTWGVTSLVSSQEQLKKDVSNLKTQQEVQNATLWQTEEVVLVGVKNDDNLQDGIEALQHEIRQIKEWRDLDHRSVKQLKETMKQQLLVTNNNQPDHPHRRRHEHQQSNHIDQKSTEVHLDFDKLDRISGAIEEKHSSVQRNLQELSQREAKLKADMEHFSQKFGTYDTELSRVYAMFYNLSFQMSSLENKMLQNQQTRFETNLSELHQSLVNFTSHMYTLEQTHATTGTTAAAHGPYNQTGGHQQQDMIQMNTVVDNHQRRIELLEMMMHERKQDNRRDHDMIDSRINRLNNSITRFYKSFDDHHAESIDVFDFIDEKFTEFNNRIAENDDRLVRVEVRVLNVSLGQCERANDNLLHGTQLDDLKETTHTLRQKVKGHDNLIDRLDHGMGRIFEDFGKHNKIMDTIVTEIKDVTDIIPQVSLLSQEVVNLVKYLPKDCYEVSLSQSKPRSGPYLIKPTGSASTAQTYCDFDNNAIWTMIQRRQDGTVSFAQDWDSYKYGFGSADGEFWIGNDNLHYLTKQGDYLLHIDMWDLEGRYWWAEYEVFRIDEEGANYNLQLESYRGNATDALSYSHDMPFSTLDRDNDHSSTHCARFYTSGWWYKHCHYGNLNGRYTVGVVWFNHDFDEWVQLKKTVMKVKRIKRDVRNNKTKTTSESEFNETTFKDYQLT